jgi:hypothetical protein
MVNPAIQNNSSVPLFIDDPVKRSKTIAQDAAGVILAGEVLGVITASGKVARAKSGSADGSEDAKYVALADIDATAGDVTAEIAAWGKVNQDKLIFDGSDDITTVVNGQPYFDWLRQYGILAVPTGNLDFLDNQ